MQKVLFKQYNQGEILLFPDRLDSTIGENHLIKHKAGETIIRSDSTCEQLCFLLKGEISIVTTSQDETYTVVEQMETPYLIEPHSL